MCGRCRAGRFTEVTIPLYYEGHAYRRGSRIRMTISAPGGDQPVWAFAQTQPARPREGADRPLAADARPGWCCRSCRACRCRRGCRRARGCAASRAAPTRPTPTDAVRAAAPAVTGPGRDRGRHPVGSPPPHEHVTTSNADGANSNAALTQTALRSAAARCRCQTRRLSARTAETLVEAGLDAAGRPRWPVPWSPARRRSSCWSGMYFGWSSGLLVWQDLLVLAIFYVVIGTRRHRRLSPPADPPQLQVQPPAAGGVRRARLGGRRGAGDRLGRHAPQAPPVLRRGGRPAQPASRPSPGLARGAVGLLPRARRLGVLRHGGRRRAALRQGPARRSVDPVRRPDLRAVGGGRAGRRLRARCGAHRNRRRRADRAAVGRRGADLLRAPRDLQHQLRMPLLRPARVRHRRRVAQRVLAGHPHLGRGLAQQPPRLPDLIPPRLAAVADRPVGRDHPRCSR